MFSLGGTIAMAGRTDGGVVARLTGHDLLAGLGALDGGVDVEVHDLGARPSADLTFDDVLDAVDAASQAVADGARGIVLTQGTDTLEETAFLVDAVWRTWRLRCGWRPRRRPGTGVRWSCSTTRCTPPRTSASRTARASRPSPRPTSGRSGGWSRTCRGSWPTCRADRRSRGSAGRGWRRPGSPCTSPRSTTTGRRSTPWRTVTR